MKRAINIPDAEPEESKFEIPSPKEHLLQVVDIYEKGSEIGDKLKLDDQTVSIRAEVVGGEENGRSLLIRLCLDQSWKGFYFTRMFLKAISAPYKGSFEIDTESFIGKQFYATVKHDKGYANIDQYNFDKKIEQQYQAPVNANPNGAAKPEDIAWEE